MRIKNFRGIAEGEVHFQPHTLLVGGNNAGKSTICEAIDLVLGVDRLYRRPVVNEHDFYQGLYKDALDDPVEIRIDLVLTGLNEEEQRRFGDQHLRLWDDAKGEFIDDEPGGIERSEEEPVEWGLPVCFIGRYDRGEDDFIGETFFCHPQPVPDELDPEQLASLGAGLSPFGRTHKRLAGYVYLRALRTGSRALSLQRGSLLDTILQLGGDGAAEMWQDTLNRLLELDPSIGQIPQLEEVRSNLRGRLGQFVNMAPGDNSAAFFASDLTRQHLREVVRLFVATQPSGHLVPYDKQGTGSINLLVFALLTIIADLKGNQSVIFAMEEPEIALPPHTQRRVTRYVLKEMGQSIITSHSAPVIEQFEPDNIVMLNRAGESLSGVPIDTAKVSRRVYMTKRRQFAEAILARGVLVVEGATEMVVFAAISATLERLRPGYMHLDFSGVTIFAGSGDGDVDRFGPVFKSLGKKTYGVYDRPNTPPSATVLANRAVFDQFWESPESGIENVLVKGIPVAALRKFLVSVSSRADYPSECGAYAATMSDDDVKKLTFKVLKARKGDAYGYAVLLIEQCETQAELPQELTKILIKIDEDLSAEIEESGELATTQPDEDASNPVNVDLES